MIVRDVYAGALLAQLAAIYQSMSPVKQASVTKRLLTSGALPIARDTPSYASVMSVCHGGAAGQLEYVAQRGSFNFAATGGLAADAEEKAFLNSRAEAKKAHLERMHHLRGREREPEVVRAEGKTAFQIAVSVANASEAKVRRVLRN
ncbi:hypothetical protein EON64_13675 [archaeon]|nr:MAG: hypothetical protein EON64_13675 [archaeon]